MSLDNNIKTADKAVNQLTKSAQKELLNAYADTLNYVRSLMAHIYEKYSKDGTLTYSDMTKYNRLKALEKEIREQILNLSGKSSAIIKTLSADVYQESFNRTAFAIEFEIQAKLGYGLINPKVIEASIQNPLSGLSLNDRLRKNRDNIIINIRQQITQGLIQGESYPKMARRIKDILEGDAAKALRVIHTEAHRVQTEGRLASMEHAAEKGVKMLKVWVATLDERVRDSHAELDGQKVGVDEDFVVNTYSVSGPGLFGIAAEDINCRCTIRPEIEGYAPEVRRSRSEGIIPYTTYDEWREKHIMR